MGRLQYPARAPWHSGCPPRAPALPADERCADRPSCGTEEPRSLLEDLTGGQRVVMRTLGDCVSWTACAPSARTVPGRPPSWPGRSVRPGAALRSAVPRHHGTTFQRTDSPYDSPASTRSDQQFCAVGSSLSTEIVPLPVRCNSAPAPMVFWPGASRRNRLRAGTSPEVGSSHGTASPSPSRPSSFSIQ